MRKAALLGLLLASVSTAAHAGLTPEQIRTLPPERIEAKLPAEHPAGYYLYASRHFAEGRKEDAVRWFYIGQLRYRIHLKTNPALDPSGDPALFASLNATIGQQINEYAGGDVPMWVAQIAAALDWDEHNPNRFTAKKQHAAIHAEIRNGLAALAKHVSENADKIREERRMRGLENRGNSAGPAESKAMP